MNLAICEEKKMKCWGPSVLYNIWLDREDNVSSLNKDHRRKHNSKKFLIQIPNSNENQYFKFLYFPIKIIVSKNWIKIKWQHNHLFSEMERNLTDISETGQNLKTVRQRKGRQRGSNSITNTVSEFTLVVLTLYCVRFSKTSSCKGYKPFSHATPNT